MEQKNNTDKNTNKKTNNTQAHQPHTSGLLQPLPDTIYHNVSLRAPLKRAERDSDVKTTKRDVFPLAKPEKCVRNVFSTLHDYAWN